MTDMKVRLFIAAFWLAVDMKVRFSCSYLPADTDMKVRLFIAASWLTVDMKVRFSGSYLPADE
jgi:hypothetical protein